jgi:phage baseplate assembly protein W
MSDFLGKDIMVDDNMEIGWSGTDVKTVSGIECVLQQIKVRLKTPKGSLFYDPAYGSDLFKFVQAEFTMQKLAYFASVVKDSIKAEPLVDNASIKVTTYENTMTSFYCKVSFAVLGYDNRLNLVVSADKKINIWEEAA